MRRLLLGFLMAFLAGCGSQDVSDPQTPGPPLAVAPPCAVGIPAVSHAANGTVVEVPQPPPFACLHRTGGISGEPLIGVSAKNGAIFAYGNGNSANPERTLWRSLDNGSSWQPLVVGAANAGTHTVSSDNYFYLDPATDRIFIADLQGVKCSAISFSDDQGETWTNTVGGCSLFDHQTMFAGPPTSGNPQGYPNIVYYCAYQAGAVARAGTTAACEKSTDGGLTWAPTGDPVTQPTVGRGNAGMPVCNSAVGHGAVGDDGVVYVPHAQCGIPTLAISEDEGATWRNVKVSDLGMADYNNFIDHEAGVGIDGSGTIYYAWNGPDRLPRLTVSRDHGATWSTPVQVGAPGLHQAVFPALDVDSAGNVALAYYGSTNAPVAPFPHAPCNPVQCPTGEDEADYANATWNGYVMLMAAGQSDLFWTGQGNPDADPLFRGSCNAVDCDALGDFLDVRLSPNGTPWAAFVDACKQACVSDPAAGNDAEEGVAVSLERAGSI